MTRDHRRKKDIRAHAAATGRSFLDAATTYARGTEPGDGAVSARRLRDELARELHTAGWPVELEHHPLGNALRIYAGPATVDVGRTGAAGWTGDEHPDDGAVFDRRAPLRVVVWAPLVVDYCEDLGRVVGVDAHEIAPTGRSVTELVAEIDQVVAAARQRDLAATANDTACGICGDHYPAAGLFEPTESRVAVCPCCAFDGDLVDPHPAQLAYSLTHGGDRSLVLPAGWAGPQALVSCLAGPELPHQLCDAWRASGIVSPPGAEWGDPGRTWVWLHAPPRRPAALARLGCGAALSHIIAALDQAHPDLRAVIHAAAAELDVDLLDAEDIGPESTPQEVIERIWPAVVAYTVALLTQHTERAGHRSPWHVLESFELPDWVEALVGEDSDLDYYHVESVLLRGIPALRDILDPRAAHED